MIQHTGLTIQKWNNTPFLKRVANIGSEVYRAMSWKNKSNKEYADMAFIRALELFDITLQTELTIPQLKELCRLRELWVDYYKFDNIYKSDQKFFENYFNYITIRALLKNNLTQS
jgi:hypothetical protein